MAAIIQTILIIFYWNMARGPINNTTAFDQMAIGCSAPNHIWTNDGLIYWHIYASLDLDELIIDLQVVFVNEMKLFKMGITYIISQDITALGRIPWNASDRN